ncbi:MAG: FKBP-type peptidyl-prolyl cis-trans isomerase [Bacteroidales bacterium]|nr:FKBP-type peptidyl-prolyl cis-trans isomerase [Bacteroidales bacterium]MBQ8810959.1 FKBP-type peptidyl-prolyl cis-trans isomerase [Bacteroidales bacterium]
MRRTIKTIVMALICLTSVSCLKEKLEEAYNKQETAIDKYIANALSSNESYTVTYNNGSSRLTRLAGEGEALKAGGSVSFYYAGYTFNGSISSSGLFVTNHQETAESEKFILTDADYSLYEITIGETELIEGLHNGLIGVQAGEECEILFSGKYAFGNSTFGIIPANSALAFKIWVVGVSND